MPLTSAMCGGQRAMCVPVQMMLLHIGPPGEIRTPYPLVRSQVLYPIELRAETAIKARIPSLP